MAYLIDSNVFLRLVPANDPDRLNVLRALAKLRADNEASSTHRKSWLSSELFALDLSRRAVVTVFRRKRPNGKLALSSGSVVWLLTV